MPRGKITRLPHAVSNAGAWNARVQGLQRERVETLAEAWRGAPIVVLGDLMSDHYLWGEVCRISPEAPVPIVEISAETTRLGGAANVARTIAALGGVPRVVGVIGDDLAGEALMAAMLAAGFSVRGMVVDPSRPTTVKTRIVAHNQHVVRTDRESRAALAPAVRTQVLAALRATLEDARALLISDYAKGVINEPLLAAALEAAADRDLPVCVDPKEALLFRYRGASLVSLNEVRATAVAGRPVTDDTVESIAEELRGRIACEALLMTRGPQGMCLVDGGPAVHIGTVARAVYDVTGAGDTVVGTATLARVAGATYREAAVLANHAAGLVVGEVGTAAPTLAVLIDSCTVPNADRETPPAEHGALADFFARSARGRRGE
jgi:D-beta-D-heptose 7-phosphate kinase/D-beta-D-heptose 1-phosphate adenosyltransferase